MTIWPRRAQTSIIRLETSTTTTLARRSYVRLSSPPKATAPSRPLAVRGHHSASSLVWHSARHPIELTHLDVSTPNHRLRLLAFGSEPTVLKREALLAHLLGKSQGPAKGTVSTIACTHVRACQPLGMQSTACTSRLQLRYTSQGPTRKGNRLNVPPVAVSSLNFGSDDS